MHALTLLSNGITPQQQYCTACCGQPWGAPMSLCGLTAARLTVCEHGCVSATGTLTAFNLRLQEASRGCDIPRHLLDCLQSYAPVQEMHACVWHNTTAAVC